MVHKVQPVPRAFREQQEVTAQPVYRALPALMACRGQPARKVYKVLPVLLVLPAWAYRALQAFRAYRVQRVLMARRALQAPQVRVLQALRVRQGPLAQAVRQPIRQV